MARQYQPVQDRDIEVAIQTASRGDMPREFREHAGPIAARDTVQQMNQRSGSSGHGKSAKRMVRRLGKGRKAGGR